MNLPSNFSDTVIYNLYYIWEFFFPALLAFSWIFPVNRLQQFKHPRLKYLIIVPQFLHISLVLLYGRLVDWLNLLVESAGGQGFVGLILRPFAWMSSQLMLLIDFIHSNEQIAFGGINLCYVLLALYFLEAGKRYLTDPRLLSQTRIVLWGTRLGLGFYVLSFLCWTVWDTPGTTAVAPYILTAAIAESESELVKT